MWEDDRLWLPAALEGRRFDAQFIFDDRKMISSRVEILDEGDGDEETSGEG